MTLILHQFKSNKKVQLWNLREFLNISEYDIVTKGSYFLTLSATALHCLLHRGSKKERKNNEYRKKKTSKWQQQQGKKWEKANCWQNVWELMERTTGTRFTVATTQLLQMSMQYPSYKYLHFSQVHQVIIGISTQRETGHIWLHWGRCCKLTLKYLTIFTRYTTLHLCRVSCSSSKLVCTNASIVSHYLRCPRAKSALLKSSP